MRKFIIIFSIIILAGAGFFVFIYQGYYPVVKVNSQSVNKNIFNRDYLATMYYLQEAYKSIDSGIEELNKEDNQKEIKRALLSKLIENSLIFEEAKKMIGKELPELVDKKINELTKEEDFKKNIEVSYGMSFNNIENDFLKPQSRKEIVEDRLLLDGKNFEEWLSEIKKQAKVEVLVNGFAWENGEVVIK